MRALAASSFSFGTRVRTVTLWAGPKKLETELSAMKIRQSSRISVTHTSSSASTPRTRSLAIMTRFTFQRSTKTPATGPTTASGSM